MLLEVLEASRCFTTSRCLRPPRLPISPQEHNGEGRIRTSEAFRRGIYSPDSLTTWVTSPKGYFLFFDCQRLSLLRWTVYLIYTNQRTLFNLPSTICTHFDCLLLSLSGTISVQFMFYLYTILRFLSTRIFRFLNFLVVSNEWICFPFIMRTL